MRFTWTIAAAALFVTGLPVCGQTLDDQPAAEETAPAAPAGESTPADLLPRNGSFDISALTSLLGQLLSQGPPPPLPLPDRQNGTQVDDSARAQPQSEPATTDRASTGTPPSGTTGNAAPYNPGFVPNHPRFMRRDALHQRIYAKRMALVNRIRASAEQSGNEQMAAQAAQLEVLVNKVHQEGLGGIVQMLGQLQAARQAENATPSTPPAVVPEEDLGEAAPLTLDVPPANQPAPDTAPPKPQPDGEAELPPALPAPGDTPQ
jgi:hypothetical protein